MKRAFVLLVAMAFSEYANAANHGPLFGLATPTNSQGEWNFDEGIFDRTTALGSQASFRELLGYGVTPHVTLSFTLPVVIGNTALPSGFRASTAGVPWTSEGTERREREAWHRS